jgi:hypothetical protein
VASALMTRINIDEAVKSNVRLSVSWNERIRREMVNNPAAHPGGDWWG